MSSLDSSDAAIPVITDNDELLQYGVVRAAIPTDTIPLHKWASELSKVTPLNVTSEGDGEYAFYRNILDEPDFPFEVILESNIGASIKKHFGVSSTDIRLDDAFCIHYNTSQTDTSGAKHMDPSDITVNMCLESENVEGSEVLFYGMQPLENIQRTKQVAKFKVEQQEGYATIHWGRHPHQTMPLTSGKRTNIVLTYCYTDPNRSDVPMRTCYDTKQS